MVALSSPGVMSVAGFLSWTPPEGGLWQLVDGVPCAMAPADRSHGALQGEMSRLLGNHPAAAGSPCSAVATPGVIPNMQPERNVRVPDLAVTCSGYEVEEATLSAPVLPIEIRSPGNQAETWINVWSHTTIPSVLEILVLQSGSIGAHRLRRRADRTWPDQADTVEAGEPVLGSIDFRASLGSIYRTTGLDPQ